MRELLFDVLNAAYSVARPTGHHEFPTASMTPIFAFTLAFLAMFSLARTQARELSGAELDRIGKRIWQNECGGSVDGLTSWNSAENFASLGIGHFIWYPAGVEGPFEESFPKMVAWFSQ